MREMRSRNTRSKQGNRSMEVERPKLKEEPQLSGAYIRSLVKQLSSSRSKSPMGQGSKSSSQDLGKLSSEGNGEASKQQQHESNSPPQPPQPHKKQVRRRLHTSRPYQQRLLNMAEARREIVTALKIHRASMKQANEQQQKLQQQNSTPSQASHASLPYSGGNTTSPPLPKYFFSNYLFSSQFSPYTNPPLSYSYPSITPPIPQNLDIPLPNQPLGLNLNVQGFNSIDASFCSGQNESSPTTASYSYSTPFMSNGEISTTSNTSPQTFCPPLDPMSTVLHPAMDDKEMAEIQSMGEQHDMEWNDAVNSVSSAWWSKFLKNMESGIDESQERIEGDGLSQHNEVFVMSSGWCDGFGLESNENIFQQQPENRYKPESYPENDALPCLDIGEIEGWDGAGLL